jgi:hypothetical protein
MEIKIKIFLLLFISFIISSCHDKKNVQILNKDLILYVKNFIDKIDKSKECQSKYITIEITKDKIYISNATPTLRNNFLGFIEFEKSYLYFYSSKEFSNFIQVYDKSFNPIEKKYNNQCDPSKDQILLINQENRNVLKPENLNTDK